MNHDKFISPYADQSLVTKTLNASSRLAELAFEFCNKFNMKLIEHPNASTGSYKKINVTTDMGIVIGALAIGDDSDGEYYLYHSNFVNKERGSKRSDSRTRDAKKIGTLLRSLATHKDIPSHDKVMERFAGGLRYAYRATQVNHTARIDIDNSMAITMAEYILKINEDNLTNNLGELKVAYEAYAKQKAKNDKNRVLSERFAEGTTSIAIFSGRVPFYVVCDTTFDSKEDKPKFTSVPKRFNSLSEIPELVSDVAIIRTYFETHKQEYDMGTNDLGAPRRDMYYEDIDIATGYSESELMWVVIPKKAP